MDSINVMMFLLVSLFLITLPSALARKCYQCDSITNPGCADANQISQLYTDCSNGGGMGYGGGSYSGSMYGNQQGGQPFGQPGIGIGGGVGGSPFAQGQMGNPGGYGGGGYGGDRCLRVMTVNMQMGGPQGPQGQPRVQRFCGSSNGMASDGCLWQGNVQICTCNSNYCNGSSRLSSASLSALSIAALATVLSLVYRSTL